MDFPTEVPSQWREEIITDQTENVPHVPGGETYKKVDTTIIKMIEFHIPVSRTRTQASKYLTPQERDFYFIRKRFQGMHVRVLVPENLPGIVSAVKFIEQGYLPQKTWAAARQQGKASFHVWDYENPNTRPFRMKLQTDYEMNGEIKQLNHIHSLKSAVVNNDIVEHVLTQSPMKNVGFYPERFAVGLHGLPFDYACLYRTIPDEIIQRPNGVAHLPVHGVLNSHHLQKLAAAAGLDPGDWFIREFFVPFILSYTGLGQDRGLWVEAHTQNLTILVESETGRLRKIFFKDLSDVLMGLHTMAVNGLLPELDIQPRARLHEHWVSTGAEHMNTPAYFTFGYPYEALLQLFEDETQKLIFSKIFLSAYLRAIGLDDEIMPKAVTSLINQVGKSPKVMTPFTDSLFIPPNEEMSYEKAVMHIIESLSALRFLSDMIGRLMVVDPQKLAAVPQVRLTEIFQKNLQQKKVNWASVMTNKDHDVLLTTVHTLHYLPVQNGIIAYALAGPDGKHTMPIGTAYMLDERDRKWVNTWAETLRPTPEQRKCLEFFEIQ